MLVALAIAATATPIAPLLAADGGKRLALVVGNSAYENVAPLINPANDATDIAQKLKSLGFDVLLATNAGQGKMSALLQDFRNRLTREHVALIFFAGHGVTVNNESFLIPVDAPAEIDLDEKGDPRAEAVHRHLVSMASVLVSARCGKDRDCVPRCLQDERGPTGFEPEGRLAADQPRGADPARDRLDGNQAEPLFRGRLSRLCHAARQRCLRWCRPNSPFTKALIKRIGTKGISIQELMIRVRKSVMEETANKQVPWEEAALNESFYFVRRRRPQRRPRQARHRRNPLLLRGRERPRGAVPPARSQQFAAQRGRAVSEHGL